MIVYEMLFADSSMAVQAKSAPAFRCNEQHEFGNQIDGTFVPCGCLFQRCDELRWRAVSQYDEARAERSAAGQIVSAAFYWLVLAAFPAAGEPLLEWRGFG
jgi:hypothetical protein